MKALAAAVALSSIASILSGAAPSSDAFGVAKPVPAADVQITDAFWAPKMEVNRRVSLPHVLARSQERGGVGPAQLVEAAGYMLEAHRDDPALVNIADQMVDRFAAGSAARASRPELGTGEFFEAAVAYYQSTGKRKALDAAIAAADAMADTYGPGKKTYISGHEGIDIGLLSLYRATGNARYLDLAKFFLDERGKDDYPRTGEYAIDRTYAQDQAPVAMQTSAVGHAVRATFLYIPLADMAGLSGQPPYARAADAIWTDAVGAKSYITGGIGSIRFHEQFGAPYELPNLSAWNETCAAYGNVGWNRSMFMLHKDATYIDEMERILYNAFLDGVSLDGDRFFYQNPLMSYGNYERFDWINTPCCPPNVVRLIASIGGYIYATDEDDIFMNLFVGSRAKVNGVTLTQDTRYPWDGHVHLAVDPAAPKTFALKIRVPGWTSDTVMPGGPYRFLDRAPTAVTFALNGAAVHPTIANGYATLARSWRAGDVVDITMPMPVRRVVADPRVKDDDGRVAIERGPLVYTAEWPDNGGHALNVVVPDAAPLGTEFRRDLLGGVQVVTASVSEVVRAPGGATTTQPHQLVAIPYFAWANRGAGEMQVWLPRQASLARPTPIVPPSPIARVQSSGGIEKKWTGYNDQNDDIAAVYDGVTPISSADESHLYFRMRPPVGEAAWVEYDFAKATTIASTDVYFADDRRFCKLPASWRIVYKDGDSWKPVVAKAAYAVSKDQFNRVTFTPVTTTAVRIEIEPATRHYKSGEIGPPDAMFLSKDMDWREFGLIEWKVK
jgi:hypothetical protein